MFKSRIKKTPEIIDAKAMTPIRFFETEYGYKMTPMNMKCNDFQYKMGLNVYSEPDKVSLCEAGLHYCGSINDLANYGDIVHSRFFEVEASTLQKSIGNESRYYPNYLSSRRYGDSKKVAKSMTLIRELTDEEIYKAFEYELAERSIFNYETFVIVRKLSAEETAKIIKEKIINTLMLKGYSEAISNVIYKEIRRRSGILGKALYEKALQYADLEISMDMRVYMLFYGD